MTWEIEIEHVAGILAGTARVEPGLNAVRASNWQGKSSFVEAIKTGLGVSTALTEGKDRGSVRLALPDRTIEVDLVRDGDEVHRRGNPYLTDGYDVTRAALFACLDETNEVRSAVREGANLEELLLRPLDFENIDERIAERMRERDQIDSELAQAREATKRIPAMTEKVTRLESELSELRERREELRTDDGSAATADARSDLARLQSERDQVESQVDRLDRSIERTETRLAEKRRELDDVEVEDVADVESDLGRAREERKRLQRDVDVLQSVYSANEAILEENRLDLVADVERELTGDSVVCWTCGSDVARETIEERLDALADRIADRRATVESRRDEVEALEARREGIEQSRRRKRDLERTVADLEEKLADERRSRDDARERLDKLETRVENLSESVDETVETITDVESDIKYREAELTEARDELESLEDRAERVEDLGEERESVQAEIERLRDRKERIRAETREAFSDAIRDVLARFDTGFESARLTADFDLVVARNGREASLDALSEGELELLGFTTALAGYRAFDVSESVPVMLVDGVGGLADDNLHTLIEYLRDRAEYLVFTAYPEYSSFDAAAISPDDWTVNTNEVASVD